MFWGIGEEMDIEQRETKGGFFKLFDWNAKSRKKLFSNNYELPGNGFLMILVYSEHVLMHLFLHFYCSLACLFFFLTTLIICCYGYA